MGTTPRIRQLMYPEHKSCLVCGHSALSSAGTDYAHAYLVKCDSCGFVFCKRIPSADELSAHYALYPRNSSVSLLTIRRYEELLEKLEPFRKNNRLLDIGCGDGHFLSVARQKGWEVYGTEFTNEAVDVCRSKGIIMQQGILREDLFAVDFDVITSFEVIEHINNPQEETKLIHHFLRSGGVFYFTTPNFNSYSRRKLKGKWNVIEYPEHLSYYTPRTITRLLHQQGFSKEWIITSGISPERIQSSQSAAPRESSAGKDESLRQSIEKKFYLRWAKNMVNFVLNLTGTGDTIKGLFKRK